ncbi:MAG: DEAD/DEAH box helicase family protein, partial [Prevotella sp.]|nr:DEAD/DEAH box helicase family protein [Prevotella sp.]
MPLTNKLIDNSCDELSMVNTLKECIESQEINTIHIATGYWDIPGLALIADELRKFLERDDKTRMFLLIGKDPYIYYNQLKEPKYKSAKYPEDFIRTEINEIKPKSEFEPAIKLLLDYCDDSENSKIQIRIFRKNENDETQFLHSKCYIFAGKKGYGLIGSSNFTRQGLIGNAELNYLECTSRMVISTDYIPGEKSHLIWFNEKWNLSEPWNKTFLEQILKPSPIGKEVKKEIDTFSPYELYIKLLQIKFGDIIDKNLSQQISSWLPKDIKCLDYQIDAVKRCISIMREHGGFMLSDVVGLGKTIVGTLIIKQFLTMREDDRRKGKVLIITPPAIKSGWDKTIKQFDADSEEKMSRNIVFITTGSIGKLTDEDDEETAIEDMTVDETDRSVFNGQLKQENYGLIIIDESHKFRNSNTQMYRALDSLIEQIWLNTGIYPYIGLLSATPQNNHPNDLKNQIYLFERNHTNSTLKKAESGNIEKFFSNTSREYNELIKKDSKIDEDERRERLKKLTTKIRDCILSDILERRTRTDIKKYYGKDIEEQGLIFPEIQGPCSLEYQMDDDLALLFSDTMKIIAPNEEDRLQTDDYLHYYRYRAIEYLANANDKKKYSGRGNRGVEDVSNQLATIMQNLLVKRLESSFTAFKQSLLNLKRYTQ